MSDEKQTAIMTPVFEGTNYKHHVCSECGGWLELSQSFCGGAHFYELSGVKCEKIRFCPICGTEIVRFSDKPIYEKALDLSPLDVFAELHREYERKAKWLYHCYISEKHQYEIDALIPLLDKNEVEVYYRDALDMATKGRFMYIKNSRAFAKLRKEFGDEEETI